MKEILVCHAYIRITTFVENWKGTKVYSTHVIMLNENIKDQMITFCNYINTMFPTIQNVEIVEVEQK